MAGRRVTGPAAGGADGCPGEQLRRPGVGPSSAGRDGTGRVEGQWPPPLAPCRRREREREKEGAATASCRSCSWVCPGSCSRELADSCSRLLPVAGRCTCEVGCLRSAVCCLSSVWCLSRTAASQPAWRPLAADDSWQRLSRHSAAGGDWQLPTAFGSVNNWRNIPQSVI